MVDATDAELSTIPSSYLERVYDAHLEHVSPLAVLRRTHSCRDVFLAKLFIPFAVIRSKL